MKEYKSNTPVKEKDLAQTPVWFIKSLEDFLGTRFALDVCALDVTAKAPDFLSLANGDDGLKDSWSDSNWCNPPFSDITPWVMKAKNEARCNRNTALIMPDNPDTKYCRAAWEYADTIIRMPFRLKFLRPDGTPFLDKKEKEQSPQFPCQVAWFTKIGLTAPTRMIYYDFRNEPCFL